MNLDDNIKVCNQSSPVYTIHFYKVQVASVMGFSVIFVEFMFQCLYHGAQDGFQNVPMMTAHQSAVVGTVLFNYSFGVTVPSWVNEMKPGTSIQNSLGFAIVFPPIYVYDKSLFSCATICGVFYYISLGIIGGVSYSFSSGLNLLAYFSATGPVTFT
jgi:hypothetical protein